MIIYIIYANIENNYLSVDRNNEYYSFITFSHLHQKANNIIKYPINHMNTITNLIIENNNIITFLGKVFIIVEYRSVYD